MAENEESLAGSQTETDPSSNVKTTRKRAMKKGRRRPRKKSRRGKESSADIARPRAVRSFPASTFQEAMILGDAFQKYAAGQTRVRRLTLFDKMGKSPDSGPSRQLISNSFRYGLTKGNYKADFLELTPEGVVATGDDVPASKKLQARFDLAIKKIAPFNHLYERLKGQKLPNKEFLIDALKETGLKEESLSECVDTFTLNAQFLGLLRTIAGSERLLTVEHALEDAGRSLGASSAASGQPESVDAVGTVSPTVNGFDTVCFYITPIGGEDSEQRKHSDFFMEYVITPALKEFGLKLVRADQIGKPGMIGKQVLEHILNARLVIADLSFHNPNVFYELCLRHATRQPTVQLIRAAEAIPFDIDQYRTVKIDTSDVYGLVPKLQTYTAEIANQVRLALKDPDSVDSPVSMYYPGLRLEWKN